MRPRSRDVQAAATTLPRSARRNGTRSVSVALPPGSYRFRYLATGGLWLDEHSADRLGSDCLLQV